MEERLASDAIDRRAAFSLAISCIRSISRILFKCSSSKDFSAAVDCSLSEVDWGVRRRFRRICSRIADDRVLPKPRESLELA